MSASVAPVWLREETEITALLHSVLDRFDRQRGEERERNVFLAAEKYLSSLARTDAQADQTWALVQELERSGVLSIRLARRNPFDPEWTDAKLAFAPESETTLREWLGREWIEPSMQLWRQAVESHAATFRGGSEALLKRRIVIPGHTPDEVVAALASLAFIEEPCTLRQLSALAFWGNSKVLDDRADLIAALFPDLQIRERALLVPIFLPEHCQGVLFIENQDTYTTAAGGFPIDCRDLALVYASGFRGTAARVRARSGALLHYAGPGTASLQGIFESWWYDNAAPPGPCWFWGDLDFAGMEILKSLRGRFDDISAWRAGYEPMLEMLRAHGGYETPISADSSPTDTDQTDTGQADTGQTDPVSTGCEFADTVLLPAIRQYGQLDQESVTAHRPFAKRRP